MITNKFRKRSVKKRCCAVSSGSNAVKIKVEGVMNTIAFQKARLCAEKLYRHLPFKFAPPQITEMFQMDWHDYIKKMKRRIGGKMWALTRPVAVFINNEFIGCDIDLLHYMSESYVFNLPADTGYYESLIAECTKSFMEKSKRKYVYFTFTGDDSVIGSFLFVLYSDLLPLTCRHFFNLCTGKYNEEESYEEAYYVNTQVHRIVKNGWIQCGGCKLSENDNNPTIEVPVIPDESYCVPHDRRGVLSMANNGKHSNHVQFVVSLKPNPWMNYFYVAFGQLIDGARTLEKIESIPTYYEDPTEKIIISHCGEYTFASEPRLETESNLFLEHRPRSFAEGEDATFYDHTFSCYSITPWLDNVVDRIDVRDTESLLMAERYLNGLYCFSTDYTPGMDMYVYEKIRPVRTKTIDTCGKSNLRALLMNFKPETMSDKEKLRFSHEISNIILSYVFNLENTEFCLQHISTNSRVIVQKILETAFKISSSIIASAERESLISNACGKVKIDKLFKTGSLGSTAIPETCLSLVQTIIKEAILHLMNINKTEE